MARSELGAGFDGAGAEVKEHGTSIAQMPRDESAAPPPQGSTSESYFAAFLVFGLFLPFVACVALAMSYIWSLDYQFAWRYTVVVGGAVWIVGAGLLRGLTSAERAQTSSFLEFRARLDALDAELALHSQDKGEPRESALAEARAYQTAISKQLGWLRDPAESRARGKLNFRRWFSLSDLQWITGHGYTSLWSKLQRAEEALILVVPAHKVLEAAGYDEARLRGSSMSDLDALIYQMNQARTVIVTANNLSEAWTKTRPDTERGREAEVIKLATPAADEAIAREQLRRIRRLINEYREDRREAIFRSRNRLYATTSVTTVFMFLAVLGAIVVAASLKPALRVDGASVVQQQLAVSQQQVAIRDGLVAGVAFFLVGALVGLFNRLRLDSESEATVNDYGLSIARLFHTPLFCGLAGLGGAVVMPVLSALSNGSNVTLPNLDEIFSLDSNISGLIFAAIFGLSPAALLSRLQAESEKYKDDLNKSESS